MKKLIVIGIQLFLVLLLVSSSANAADWRFPLGFSYVGNFHKVVDLHKDNLEAEGFNVDTSWEVPVGLTFQPYVEFDYGLGIGMGLGPMMFISTGGDADFFNLPVNLNLRYSFLPKEKISPYVRAGASYNIASGDYVDNSKIGFLGAVGVEFSRKSPVGFGFEVGVDTSKIEFKDLERGGTKDIKPINWWASIFVVF
jgi:opacity protein-like surface antigen